MLLILGVEFPWLAAFHYNIAILKYFPAEFQFCERLLRIPYGEKVYSYSGQMKIISYYF